MSKYSKQNLINKKIDQYILLGLLVVSGFLAALFWQKNTLAVYDASGHIAAVESMRNFWPAFSGWNARELLGWPQGVFYPSFFHWLAAGLSFVVGIPLAIKILISSAFIALPFSLSAFARSLIENKFWAAVITLALFLLILVFPNFLGTGVRSLFQIGLLSNFFVLPLFFFFLASLSREEPKQNWLVTAILFSLVVLTHLVAAAVAGLYLVIYFASRLFLEKKFKFRIYLKIIALALLLTAFFWAPFITNLGFSSVSRHVSAYFWPNVVVFLAATILAISAWRKKEINLLVLSKTAAIFTFLASIDSFLISRFGTSFVLYPFHIYRFQPFAYLLFAAAVLLVLAKWPLFDFIEKNKRLSSSVVGAGLLLVVLTLIIRNPANLPKAEFEVTKPNEVAGRFLETFRRSEVDPFWYSFQTTLVEKNPKATWAYGLFTDSTPNGPYLGSLIKSLNPNLYPEGEGNFLETKFVDQQRIPALLDLFGINYLISLDDQKKNVVGTWSSGGETKYYNSEKVSDSGLFEVVKLPLVPVEKDWNQKVEEWWSEKGTIKQLPYFSKSGQPAPVCTAGLENTQVKVASSNKQQTRFELEIASAENVPVLAKISYYPYWRAYDYGKEIPIYRTAPNLMLVYAHGKVTLEYKEPVWVKGLYLVSAATLVRVVFLIFRSRSKNH